MPNIQERLDEISRFPNGWMDGQGKAFADKDLTLAGRLLLNLCEGFDLDHPHIYPALPNALACEWTFGANGEIEVLLRLDFESRTLFLSSTNLQSDDSTDASWPLDESSSLAIQNAGRILSRISLNDKAA
jgi:hypothetical protein